MVKPVVKQGELEPLPDILVEYYPDTETLVVETGGQRAEGEDIARGLTVFYDHDNKVAGFTLESAELLLKPFVNAVAVRNKGK